MSDELLTPQQRLAISRRALLEELQGGREGYAGPARGPLRGSMPLGRPVWARMAGKTLQRWWRRHPANAVGQLARPVIERYAREQPVKLMAVAAATGAVAVLVRPWRLLSVTAVVAALLKTSDVADIVTTLMQKTAPHERKNEP